MGPKRVFWPSIEIVCPHQGLHILFEDSGSGIDPGERAKLAKNGSRRAKMGQSVENQWKTALWAVQSPWAKYGVRNRQSEPHIPS